jgi:uncharacterized protein (DUF362 family)
MTDTESIGKKLSRREFLKYQVRGSLWLAAAAAGVTLPGKKLLAAPAPADIAVAKGAPAAATRAAVGLLGGMGAFVKKGDRVVIKPNMSFPTPPERASNTHPDVVRELAAMCREAGAASIRVLDNPLAPAERCLENSGIPAACQGIDAGMVHMVTDPSLYQEKDIPGGRVLTRTDIMRAVLQADVLIAAPVAKSHSGAGVSLSMKGMMGLIYDRRILHALDLHTGIVDLATILRADLAVIDATRVLSSGGPGGPGKVLRADRVIASRDMVAADAYTVSAFEWYGRKFAPNQVRYIREAHQRGLGRMDIENLTIRTVTA